MTLLKATIPPVFDRFELWAMELRLSHLQAQLTSPQTPKTERDQLKTAIHAAKTELHNARRPDRLTGVPT